MSSPSFLVVVVVTLLLCLIITQAAEKSETKESGRHKRMERLRRSFRESFRRRKDHVPESSKPHQWQSDEAAVRAGTCNFYVKVCLYLAIFLFIYLYFFWSSNSIYLFTVLLTCACYWAVAVSGMRRGLRVAWHARVRGSAQSAQSKLRIQGLCRQIYSLSLFHLQHRTLGADRSKESYTFPATDYESSKKTPKYEIDIYIYTFRSTIDLFFFIFLF